MIRKHQERPYEDNKIQSFPEEILCVAEYVPDQWLEDPEGDTLIERGMRGYRFETDVYSLDMQMSPMVGTFRPGQWYRFTIEHDPPRFEMG